MLLTYLERILLVVWCSVTLLINLAGNLLTLLAASTPRALRLDKISVSIIQSIAVSDLMMAVSSTLPSLVSLIADRWVFGGVLCHASYYLNSTARFSAVLLVCALHISKLYTLMDPLGAIGRRRRTARIVLLSVWAVSIVAPRVVTIYSQKVQFSYLVYICQVAPDGSIPDWMYFYHVLLIMVPSALAMITCVLLSLLVRRFSCRMNTQGIFTTIYVGVTYIVVFGPLMVNVIGSFVLKGQSPMFSIVSYRLLSFFFYANGVFNFLVYIVSVKSFSIFARKILRRAFHCCKMKYDDFMEAVGKK